jgi:hypothetical protein
MSEVSAFVSFRIPVKRSRKISGFQAVGTHGNGIGILTQSTLLPTAEDGEITLLTCRRGPVTLWSQCHLVYRKSVTSPRLESVYPVREKACAGANYTL